MSLGSFLGGLAKKALPVVGGILGGPLGGLAGGAISGALGGGKKPTAMAGVPASTYDSQFDTAISDEQKRRKQLQGQSDAAGAGVDQGISRVEGLQPTSYAPTASEGVDLNGVGNFDPTEQRGVNFDELGGIDLEGVRNFKSTNLEGDTSGSDLEAWDRAGGAGGPSALEGFSPSEFDAGAAVKEYATGAASDFFKNADTSLRGIRSQSVGAGRFGTGFVDKDQQDAFTELGRGFTSDLARTAVSAAGITSNSRTAADQMRLGRGQAIDVNSRARLDRSLDARKTAAGFKFNRANAIDDRALDATKSAASLSIQKGTNMGDLALRRAGGIDASRQKAVTDAAGMGLDRAKTVDTLRLNNSQFGDTYRQNNAQFGVGARQNRTNQIGNAEETSSNRYFDALVGGINKTQNAKNAAAERKSNTTNGIIGTLGQLGGAALDYFGNKKQAVVR